MSPTFKLTLEPVDLAELIDDIALRFVARAQSQGVQMLTSLPGNSEARPVASVDIELFERAVANLLDNSLKFCPPGASIEMKATLVAAARRVEVAIVDSGRGIASADLPHLFDRFYQSRHTVAPATADDGKGLGLAIVKRIVELHGGELSVSSELGKGTSVTIALPV